jgi:hypothetical protein
LHWGQVERHPERVRGARAFRDVRATSRVRLVATPGSQPDYAESAIEGACQRAEAWFRSLPTFPTRAVVGGGQVVARRSPAILSERDSVINFARFLNEEGMPWDAIHHEVSMSRWIFEEPHPAATAMAPAQRRRRIDLVLVNTDDFLRRSSRRQHRGSSSTPFSNSATSPTTGRCRGHASLAATRTGGA